MRSRRKLITAALVAALLVIYFVGSQFYYERRISPKGLPTAREFFERFGEPRSVSVVAHDGKSYYEFAAPPPPRYLLVFASSPPVYIFDEHGLFVAWSRDPAVEPKYREQWPLQGMEEIALATVKQR